MKNVKRLKKKNLVIGIISIILIIVLIVALVFLIGKKESQEEKLTNMLNDMGIDFYENYYYTQLGTTDEERKEFLKKFENIGIKVNLDNLSRYNTNKNKELLKEFVNSKTKEECDKENTRVIIYPKDPYEKKSYEIKTELVCGFEEA